MPFAKCLSLLAELHQLDQQLVCLACPACGKSEPSLICKRDRYFLRVELSACRACGLIYLARGLQGDPEARFYEQLYPRMMSDPLERSALGVSEMIAGYRYSSISSIIGAIKSVLDVGAGLGYFLNTCRAHGCSQYVGLEPGSLQRAHAVQVLGLGDGVRNEALDDRTELPFAPQLVTLFHVLEHLEQPGQALRKISELIDPRGWLVLEVPDIEADWRALGLMQIHVSHRSYFSEGSLRRLLAANGFRVERVQREASGIYCGNLRVYARLGSARQPGVLDPLTLPDMCRNVREQIRPWSIRHGYPRAAIRLARLTLRKT